MYKYKKYNLAGREMKKEPTKNLKYYWDNRYSYIVNFVKKYLYLIISLIIFLFVSAVLLFFVSMGVKDILFLFLFICFFIFLFFCFFIFLPRFFEKEDIVKFTSIISLSLTVIFTLWAGNSILGPANFYSLPPQWMISFMRFFYSFDPFYAFLLLWVVSLLPITFFFSKESRFRGKKESLSYKLLFVVFILLLTCVPYFMKEEPKLWITIVEKNHNGFYESKEMHKFY